MFVTMGQILEKLVKNETGEIIVDKKSHERFARGLSANRNIT
jgi:hypothetical protein